MKKGALLLYAYPKEGNASTIVEHTNSFLKYSKLNIVGINVIRGLPPLINLKDFSLVLLHYSLFSAIPLERLEQSLDPKNQHVVAFFQDENHNCIERGKYIDNLFVDAVFSCLTYKDFFTVYGARKSVKRVFETLTGYVDDSLVKKGLQNFRERNERQIDIGYRARELPYFMGRGAQEKTRIGRDLAYMLEGQNLNLDIETRESKRLYGNNWDLFVADCKSMIGVEAGTSTFDLDGTIKLECEEYIRNNPRASFEDVHAAVLAEHEDLIYYRTISPRVFECAAFKVLMIMYEGHYSGILIPDKHYVSLKKDYSNLEEVLTIAADPVRSNKIIEQAYKDLIESDKYSYSNFIHKFDNELASLFGKDSMRRSTLSKPAALYHKLAIQFWQFLLGLIENVLSWIVVEGERNKNSLVMRIKSNQKMKKIVKKILLWELIKEKILKGHV